MHRCVWNATADVRGKSWIASTASTAAATVLPTSAERDSVRTAETPPKTATPQSRAARQAPLDAVRVGIRKVAPTSRQRRQAMIISTMSSHQRSVEAGHIPGHTPLFQHASAAGTTSNRQHQFDHALLLRGASSLHRSSSGSRSGIEQSRMPEQEKLVVTCDDGEHLLFHFQRLRTGTAKTQALDRHGVLMHASVIQSRRPSPLIATHANSTLRTLAIHRVRSSASPTSNIAGAVQQLGPVMLSHPTRLHFSPVAAPSKL